MDKSMIARNERVSPYVAALPFENGKPAMRPTGHVFLTPEWVHELTRALQLARESDLYFRYLSSAFSLRMVYLVRKIPRELREWYGGSSQAVIFLRVEKGVVKKVELGRELPGEKIQLMLASDYWVARKLLLGESSLTVSFFNGRLKVEAVNGFRSWPKLAAKAVLAAGLILKFARNVPTVYSGTS